jgi:SAM-dependent methyltransferase
MVKKINNLRGCPSCESIRHIFLYSNQMAPLDDLDMSYEVAGCQECGQVYANRLPEREIYDNYYTTMSKYDQKHSISDFSTSDVLRTSAYVSICRPYLSAQTGIADIGCATGYLLNEFKREGWTNVYGVDPSPLAPKRSAELFGLETIKQGNIIDAHKYINFDQIGLVCITGVLEHLYTPINELKSLLDYLIPGTLVLIDVPALDNFENEVYEPFGELSIEHVQWFSKHGLKNLVKKLGGNLLNLDIVRTDSTAVCDSLIGLFRAGEPNESCEVLQSSLKDIEVMKSYLSGSAKKNQTALDALFVIPGPWIVYGAGSHTARLIPLLIQNGLDNRLEMIVDGNLNIQGKNIGRWTIEPPSRIKSLSQKIPIVISSFRSQTAICDFLQKKYLNPIICLY